MQALGPDILEATAYAQTMSPDEIEEAIDYLLNEVFSSSLAIPGFTLTPRIEYSMGKILSVTISYPADPAIELHCFPFSELSSPCHRGGTALPFRREVEERSGGVSESL